VQQVDVRGVQMDEAHSKLRRRRAEWIHTALAMGSWFLLWVDFGPRTQDTAATLIAQVAARVRTLPLFLTDGWKAYPAALLQVVGVVYRRRRWGWGCRFRGRRSGTLQLLRQGRPHVWRGIRRRTAGGRRLSPSRQAEAADACDEGHGSYPATRGPHEHAPRSRLCMMLSPIPLCGAESGHRAAAMPGLLGSPTLGSTELSKQPLGDRTRA
jgi:hypothetical protein